MADKHLTPRMSSVLGYASAVADQYGHDYIGTEHVLLGLLAEEHGVAGRVLRDLGVADEAVRWLRAGMEGNGDSPASAP
jgi:ATP-dependent Clp protease ATP-binding subunit ClpC